MNSYDYSPDFQCDWTGGAPTRLVVDWDKEIAWLELYEPPDYKDLSNDEKTVWEEAERACSEWGKRTCRNVSDYNRLLEGLGEDAIEIAGIYESDDEDESEFEP